MASWQSHWLNGWGSAPPVTGTASFTQGAASWDAAAVESYVFTASFAQVAAWEAAASESITATVSFAQGVSRSGTYESATTYNAATPYDGSLLGWLANLDAEEAGPVTSTATWEQAAAAWSALASQVISGTATFEQVNAWAASLVETIRDPVRLYDDAGTTYNAAIPYSGGTPATWSQEASWAALGMSAEDVVADATFEQAAASWLAATSQLVVGSGTWEQVNTWLAESLEAFISTATWEQGQSWESTGDVANPVVDSTGSWTQAAATWDATASHPVIEFESHGGRNIIIRRHVFGHSGWEQAPVSWAAVMTSDDPVSGIDRRAMEEELLLVGALG